eukprot:CAMPEP_0201688430 /NCGR_PEP_ID=MMETSP0578-20130828/2181_1 /ASSEMBLY_ACC=CAM_ASM_000663 /TAXON_ID=267565 /ORGANISM="Skeletonema grethea, Strain CCMP 1804" /LENGTH=449 /DNA_ID=CAMNT_0048172741 /DNA_START=196 /DNA_END=1545 /DNA_ORIENTATION=+
MMNPDDYDSPRKRKKIKIKESVIDHTYRDYSQVEVPPEDDDGDGSQRPIQPNFPAKLHDIVSNPEYRHIIAWQPHGRCWKVIDKYLLSTVICPKYFSHSKFESFNRSVNGWGFKRLLNQGPDYKCYYHECFLRGRPELTKMMQRLINPGKRLPDKAGEPDFYEISRQYPLPAGPAVSESNPMLRTPAPFAGGYQKPPAPSTTPAAGGGGEGAGGPPAPGQMPGQAGAAGGYPYPYPGMPYPGHPQYGQPPGYPQGMPQQAYGWPGQPMPPFSPGGTGGSDPNTPQPGSGGAAAAPGGAPAAAGGGSGAPAGAPAPGQMPGGMPGYPGYPYPPMHPHMYWQQAQYMGSPYGQFQQQPFYPPGYAPGSPGKGGPGGPPGFDPNQQPGGPPGAPGATAPEGKADDSDAGSEGEKKPSAEEGGEEEAPEKGKEEKEESKEPKESTGASESLPF